MGGDSRKNRGGTARDIAWERKGAGPGAMI